MERGHSAVRWRLRGTQDRRRPIGGCDRRDQPVIRPGAARRAVALVGEVARRARPDYSRGGAGGAGVADDSELLRGLDARVSARMRVGSRGCRRRRMAGVPGCSGRGLARGLGLPSGADLRQPQVGGHAPTGWRRAAGLADGVAGQTDTPYSGRTPTPGPSARRDGGPRRRKSIWPCDRPS